MNYRHSYHAGNFSDVIKHVIVIALIAEFLRKDTPFCYLDTHSGPGYYDLFSESSKKNKEYLSGIEKIIQEERLPPMVKRYLNTVHQINNRLLASKYASLRYYPGSPMIARYFARPHDRIIACELQPQEYQELRKTFQGDKIVSVHHTDGFLGLKAFLPPRERRGFVLIDPPYENPDEFMRIAQSLSHAMKRWETGTYAIWYPIKERILVQKFYRTLIESVKKPILAAEMTVYPDIPNHLNGSGMVIINPPWKFDQTLKDIFPWLWKTLSVNEQGEQRVYMLSS